MYFSCSLFLFVWCAVGLAQEEWKNHPDIVQCGSKCFAADKLSCHKGCEFAYALTLAPKDYKYTPSCAAACNDKFSLDGERSACIEGCVNFISTRVDVSQKDTNGFFNPLREFAEKISNYFRQRFNRLLGNEETTTVMQDESTDSALNRELSEALQRANVDFQKQQGIDSDQDGPVIRTHVRIIMLSDPNEELVNPEFPESEKFRKSFELLGAPAGESDGVASENDRSVEVPRGTMCVKFLNGLHHVFKNPFNLLLALSLLALLLLLLAQIALCVLRKPRPQSESVYAQLPSYEEAVEIKIPLDMQDYGFKVEEKSKPSDENPQA